jgi:hypothetical protein
MPANRDPQTPLLAVMQEILAELRMLRKDMARIPPPAQPVAGELPADLAAQALLLSQPISIDLEVLRDVMPGPPVGPPPPVKRHRRSAKSPLAEPWSPSQASILHHLSPSRLDILGEGDKTRHTDFRGEAPLRRLLYDHFDELKPVVKLVKAGLKERTRQTIRLSPRPIETALQASFLQQLHHAGLISLDKQHTGTTFHFTSNPRPEFIGFINGLWLEREIFRLVQTWRPEQWSAVSILANLQCRHPDKGPCEFDLLLPLSEGPPAYLDPKTGQLSSEYEKIQRNRSILNWPKARTFIVLPTKRTETIHRWQQRLASHATVVSTATLMETLRKLP